MSRSYEVTLERSAWEWDEQLGFRRSLEDAKALAAGHAGSGVTLEWTPVTTFLGKEYRSMKGVWKAVVTDGEYWIVRS